MKETFQNLIAYFKNPVLEKDSNLNLKYRFKIFFNLLVISIATSMLITPLFALLETLQLVDLQNHKLEEMFKGMDVFQLLLNAAITIPIIEEFIFRGPMTLFKKPKSFKYAFYVSSSIFGSIHIFNFEITTNVLILTPLLVLPQLLVGAYYGYVRVRFGLLWSMLLHGCYNGILILISYLFES
jgi:membrane protease YdiL (CAAX protease family)